MSKGQEEETLKDDQKTAKETKKLDSKINIAKPVEFKVHKDYLKKLLKELKKNKSSTRFINFVESGLTLKEIERRKKRET